MQNEFIGITCNKDDHLDGFTPLSDIELLKKGYKESYESLIIICQNYEPEEQDESQDDYDSFRDESSEKLEKRIKQEEPARTTKTAIISNSKQHPEKEAPKPDEMIAKKE